MKSITVGSIFTSALLLADFAQGADRHISLPFHETFQKPPAETGWTANASPGNAIGVVDGVLKIDAAQNTYAHIERLLGLDAFRLEATFTAGDGASYPAENLNNNYSDPGPCTETRIHSVAVTELPKGRERLTEAEKRQITEWGRDVGSCKKALHKGY